MAVLRKARSVLEPLGPTKYLGECIAFLGDCADYSGDYETARRLLIEAVSMYRALGDSSGLWGVLCNFAEIEFANGNAERAVEMVQEIFAAAPKERNRLDLIMLARSNLAGYLLALGHVDEAREAAQTSLREIRSVGGRWHYAVSALEHLAVVAAELGQFDRAARLLGYGEHWYEVNVEYFRDFNERRSLARTGVLLASALSDEDRTRLMREGAGWSEDKAAEEALAI